MDDETNLTQTSGPKNLKLILIVLGLILLAGILGWWLGHSNSTVSKPPNGVNSSASNDNAASAADVNSIITYTLPEGWKDATCTSQTSTVFIVPSGATLHCDSDSIAPIKISVDPQNTTDCQELGNVQNVRKHICKSLYIGGHKTLQASTEYPKSSTYPVDTTISDYYINTGKGVIRIQYTYTSSNNYQLGFDQLANSVRVKS